MVLARFAQPGPPACSPRVHTLHRLVHIDRDLLARAFSLAAVAQRLTSEAREPIEILVDAHSIDPLVFSPVWASAAAAGKRQLRSLDVPTPPPGARARAYRHLGLIPRLDDGEVFESSGEDAAMVVPFEVLNAVINEYIAGAGLAPVMFKAAGETDPVGFVGLPSLPTLMGADLFSTGQPTIEPAGDDLLVTLPAAVVGVQSGSGQSTWIELNLQLTYELAAERGEDGAVRAGLGARRVNPALDMITVSVPEPRVLEEVMASLGLPVRLDADGGVVTLDTTPIEELLIPRLERVMEVMVIELLHNLTLPTLDLPASLASDVQPAGTPFRYVPIRDIGGPSPAAVRISGGAIVVAGAFTRIGQECTSDADCACDPADGEVWCTSASMYCPAEESWCRD